MKENNKTGNFTDREWEKIASALSGENGQNDDLLSRFMNDDMSQTGKKWKELKEISGSDEIDVDRAWKNLSGRINEREAGITPDLPVFRLRFMKVAATLIILMTLGAAIGAVYLRNTDAFAKKITCSTGNDVKNMKVNLPDGSVISLNRNSELTYRTTFGKKGRNVELKGEAYFEISHDAAKPFIISAGEANVKVVGTSFNVITRNAENAVEVFVTTGKVMLNDNSGAKSIALEPGYVGKMNAKTSEKILNDNPNYLAWNTGKLVYNGQKLDIVFRDLKRVYNMDIVADETSILDNLWTSPIDNQEPETIIRLISASFNLKYTKDGEVYHLSKK